MSSRYPINETEYARFEVPEENQVSFTGLLSSGGQIIVPAEVRNGKLVPGMTIEVGDKIEVLYVAVHKKLMD
jgi:hypothetical protein